MQQSASESATLTFKGNVLHSETESRASFCRGGGSLQFNIERMDSWSFQLIKIDFGRTQEIVCIEGIGKVPDEVSIVVVTVIHANRHLWSSIRSQLPFAKKDTIRRSRVAIWYRRRR